MNSFHIVHAHYRSRDAYLSGHIPGAIDIGAIRCAFIMLYAGVKDVRVLNGGFQSWSDEGYEISFTDEPKKPVREFGALIPQKPELAVDTPGAKEMLRSASRFFYDEAGSALSEEITRLPEYYPTRTEKAILKEYADVITGNLADAYIVELGSGDCSKISILFDAISPERRRTISYIPVDVSRAAIVKSADTLSRKYPEISIYGMLADFLKHLGDIPGENRKIICFFGSTIGNLDPAQTSRFLLNISSEMREGDQLLLGLDMIKDIRVLEDAYNDTQEVTAAFNRNILNVINGHAKTDFDPLLFDHLAFYNNLIS